MSKRSINPKTQKALEREKLWIAREFFRKPGVLKASNHGLRSGSKDDYYFDLDYMLNEPYQAEMVLDIYASLINAIKKEAPIDFLAFIEKASGGTVGAIRLAVALSIKTSLPNFSVRLRKEISFDKIKAQMSKEGLNKYRGIIITDHCTTGNEVLLAAQALRKNNALVEDAIIYTIRPDKFQWDKFKDNKINLRYAYKLPSSYKDVPPGVNDVDAISVAINF